MKKSTTRLITFTLLLTTFLLASCGTEGVQQHKQGKRIGTWMAYQDKANWVGTKSMPVMASVVGGGESTSQDSVKHINTPNGQFITIKKGTNTAFRLTVVDSTLNMTPNELARNDSLIFGYKKYFHVKINDKVQHNGMWATKYWHGLMDEPFYLMRLSKSFKYDCNISSTNESAKIIFKVIDYTFNIKTSEMIDSTIIKHILNISGLRPTLNYMLCK